MEALTEAVRQGKTRYVGFSEWPLDKIEAAAKLPGVVRFVSSQPQYSLLWPNPENEIFPRCAELGIGQIVWSPLAQGVLTGKYKPGAPPPAGSRAGHESMGAMLPKRWLRAPVLTAVQQVKLMAEREAGVSLAAICTCLGVAQARSVLGDRWSDASRTSGGERRRGGIRDCTGAFREGRGHLGAVQRIALRALPDQME